MISCPRAAWRCGSSVGRSGPPILDCEATGYDLLFFDEGQSCPEGGPGRSRQLVGVGVHD